MSSTPLPPILDNAFAHSQPDAVFAALLPAICQVLETDRCFLEVRNPHTRLHHNICWRQDLTLPDTSTDGWQPEQEWEKEDPMFAAALRTADSIYVEDVETADASVLNLEFERKYFGHRALVHAHICHENMLWGILQPCVFRQPRIWSQFDRTIIDQITDKLTPIVVQYVRQSSPT